MSNKNQYPELDKAYAYFLSVKMDYLDDYHQKYLLIHSNQVIGIYETSREAITDAMQKHDLKPGSFAVQQLLREGEARPAHLKMQFQ